MGPAGANAGGRLDQAVHGGLIAEDRLARAIMAAMIDGETDARVLAEMARGRMETQKSQIYTALEGNFNANHTQLAKWIPMPIGSTAWTSRWPSSTMAITAACEPSGRTRSSCWRQSPGVGPPGRADHRGRDRHRHGAVPHGRAPGILGRPGAIDVQVRGQTHPGRAPPRQQVADRDAGRGGRIGRPDARQELPRRPARPAHPSTRDEPGPDRGGSPILTTAYYVFKRDEPYRDLGPEWLAQRNEEAHTRRLVAQFEKLGHSVVTRSRRPDPSTQRGVGLRPTR